MEKIGGWTKRPLAAGACSLCGNEGIGNLGLWLCERHISTIAREHGYLLEATLREQIAGKILAKCENKTETNTSEFGSHEVVGCLEFIQLEDTAYYEVTCTHAEDAAIAGGKNEAH